MVTHQPLELWFQVRILAGLLYWNKKKQRQDLSRMKELQTIILAAGKGTRMKSAVPKVLHQVCGKPLVHYVLDLARRLGSSKINLILGHQSALIRAAVGRDTRLRIVIQKKLLGTADAVKSAAGLLRRCKGDVLILSGDAILLRQKTLKNLIQKHRQSQSALTFLTTVTQQPQGYGRIIRGFGGKAVAVREEKDATDYEKNIMEVNVGVYCFQASVLLDAVKQIKLNPKKKEYYLTDIVGILADQKRKIETLETEDPTEGLGINTRVDLAQAEAVIRQRILKEFMLKGVTILDPRTTMIAHDVTIGPDTVIHPFTVIENNVRIGPACRIGPFARLRPGTRLAREVELGNFVEVSRTQMGKQTVMKHFSFLGDARIGTRVNIGAGAVTANYDGKEKNISRIADQAFIGSDSILVAPVKIGKAAVTGAGSVVTKGQSVPAGRTAVGVPARIRDPKPQKARVNRK